MSRKCSFYLATSRADATRVEAMVQSGLDIATRWATAEPYSDEAGDFIAVDVQASDDVDIGVFVAELRAKVEAVGYVTYNEAEFDGLTGRDDPGLAAGVRSGPGSDLKSGMVERI